MTIKKTEPLSGTIDYLIKVDKTQSNRYSYAGMEVIWRRNNLSTFGPNELIWQNGKNIHSHRCTK